MNVRHVITSGIGLFGAACAAQAQVNFKSANTVATGPNAVAVVVGDLNGDSKADILAVNRGGSAAPDDGTLTIQFNLLAGAFAAPVQVNSGRLLRPIAAAIADFDGDGNADIAAAILGSDNVTIYLGQGLGTYDNGTSFAVGDAPQAIVVGDLDGANGPDIVVSNDGDDTLSVLLSNDSGAFAPAVSVPVQIVNKRTNPRGIALGDFTGDGVKDIAVALFGQNQIAIVPGNGNGTFDDTAIKFIDTGNDPAGLAAADLDGDGDLDLVAANTVGDSVTVALNDGAGGFAASDVPAGNGSASLAVADLNADGKLDIATANVEGDNASVLLGNGNGTFAAAKTFTTDSGPTGIAAGDLDGSGNLDLVTANDEGGSVSILAAAAADDGAIDDATDVLGNCAPGCGPAGLMPVALTFLGIVSMKRPRRRA